MIILDTNVLSALMMREPPAKVIAWLDAQPAESIWTTAVTVFEIEYGLRRLPEGNRRDALESAVREMLDEDLGGRILVFDAPAALASGLLAAELESAGRRIEIRDVQIGGIVRARQALLATRNVKHFERACPVVNPWDE